MRSLRQGYRVYVLLRFWKVRIVLIMSIFENSGQRMRTKTIWLELPCQSRNPLILFSPEVRIMRSGSGLGKVRGVHSGSYGPLRNLRRR